MQVLKKEKQYERKITINMVNIQGISKRKVLELENLLQRNCDLICLTETQLKFDKINLSKGIDKVEEMRTKDDKKGGGLLIIYKVSENLNIKKVNTACADILYAVVTIVDKVLHLVLVYFSVMKTSKDKERNLVIKKEIEKKYLKIDKENKRQLWF